MAPRTSAGSGFRPDKKRQFYFLHGDDEAAIEGAKNRIVEMHLSSNEREENYREIIPSGSPPALKKVLGDVLSELSTVSFLPDLKRVVTLYTVSDFFEARAAKGRSSRAKAVEPAKSSPSEHLAAFIEKELPSLPAILIVIAIEDYEKWKRVNAQNPVHKLAQDTSALYAFKESSPQFSFFDALFARNSIEALTLWRQWLERTSNSPKPYMQLAAQLRLLIQAKTASSGQLQQRGLSKAQFAKDFMPAEADKSLFSIRPEFRQEKLMRAAGNFTFAELLGAYEKLITIQKYAIPLNSDPYVPDKALMSELWICEFTGGREG